MSTEEKGKTILSHLQSNFIRIHNDGEYNSSEGRRRRRRDYRNDTSWITAVRLAVTVGAIEPEIDPRGESKEEEGKAKSQHVYLTDDSYCFNLRAFANELASKTRNKGERDRGERDGELLDICYDTKDLCIHELTIDSSDELLVI
ncbi:hypothetical protein DY000_02031833 [Brassica cretica]|uniref:Uncharacterized protein n=1 Tax=Brassica cretica TaxID=69181 RepID=A0ABQ7DV37_BRACR|nr:hypothetical protein DY000_02031833 [Brassica cretica]